MPNIAAEVGVAGTRICKTDVGWIGAGYEFAFEGVSQCVGGIEDNSDGRRFVWTVEGWAGTHRLAVMWTGDDSGSMDYVRWQIPTFIGSGFSAQAHVSGDVDGIFGGSPESYVRDLQFKALTTTIMVMSGWAPNPDKQPWTFGEPYTTYNRAALKLKASLTPYAYALSREAYDTGVPPVRALLLEFPADEFLYTPNASYQFMTGPFLMSAPVYVEGAVTRDGIYLPAGTQWVGWLDGALFDGNATLNNFSAPLDTLPLFVKAGAIIPRWPDLAYFNEAPWDPLTLEVWPAGNTSFELYEDDGVTRLALPPTSAFAKTLVSVAAPIDYLSHATSANVTITIAATRGSYQGMLPSRGFMINVRSRFPPLDVVRSGGRQHAPPNVLPKMGSAAELDAASTGWFYDASVQQGLLMVKLADVVAAEGATVTLSNGPSYPRVGTEVCDTVAHHEVDEQRFAYSAATRKFAVFGTANCLTVSEHEDNDSHTPAIEVQPCAAALDDVQQFDLQPSGQITRASDAGLCLDQDVSDDRVISYSCHDAASAGNQAWTVESSTQHVVSRANGLCMAVLP
jgi:hypothetical protein